MKSDNIMTLVYKNQWHVYSDETQQFVKSSRQNIVKALKGQGCSDERGFTKSRADILSWARFNLPQDENGRVIVK